MRGAALDLTVNVRVDSGSRPPELLETSGSRLIRFSRGSYHTDKMRRWRHCIIEYQISTIFSRRKYLVYLDIGMSILLTN
jgi:hypothetical protein